MSKCPVLESRFKREHTNLTADADSSPHQHSTSVWRSDRNGVRRRVGSRDRSLTGSPQSAKRLQSAATQCKPRHRHRHRHRPTPPSSITTPFQRPHPAALLRARHPLLQLRPLKSLPKTDTTQANLLQCVISLDPRFGFVLVVWDSNAPTYRLNLVLAHTATLPAVWVYDYVLSAVRATRERCDPPGLVSQPRLLRQFAVFFYFMF